MTLPTSEALEECVIGAIILAPDAAFKRMGKTWTPNAFYNPRHRKVATALHEMRTKGLTIDLPLTAEYLQQSGVLMDIGGPYQLVEYTNRVAQENNVRDHMQQIRAKYIARKQLETYQQASRELMEGADAIRTAQTVADKVSRYATTGKDEQLQHVQDVNILKAVLHAKINGTAGVPSGFPDIDRITGGWQQGDIIILGARPGMGKTSLALKFAVEAAKQKHATGIITLEMSNAQLKRRLVSMEARISANTMKTGQVTDSQLNSIEIAEDTINGLNIYLEQSSYTPFAIRQTMREMVEKGCKVIFIDYVQQMTPDGKRHGQRNNEIETFAVELQRAAKEYNVPVVLLSQLSRPPKGQAVRPPQLTDLRDSGALEQVADLVLFVHRDYYYRQDEDNPLDENGDPIKDRADIIISKHRDGATGYIDARFIADFALFESVENYDISTAPMTNNIDTETQDVPF